MSDDPTLDLTSVLLKHAKSMNSNQLAVWRRLLAEELPEVLKDTAERAKQEAQGTKKLKQEEHKQ